MVDGDRGALQLESVTVDRARRDYVFAGLEDVVGTDEQGARVMAALLDGGVSPSQDTYLVTYTLRASPDARGTFRVTVPSGDTVLLDSGGRPTRVPHAPSAAISVR